VYVMHGTSAKRRNQAVSFNMRCPTLTQP
jgi:hypothetical protein